MVESSLADLEIRQHPRRRWAPLWIAVALFGFVLASVGLAQVWDVPAVADPKVVILDTFGPCLPSNPEEGGPPPEDEILMVGGDVTPPVLLSAPPPRYSKLALRARVEGVVILRAVIDERGQVTEVRILRGLPMGLKQAAVDNAWDWRFEPATLGGRPVKVYYNLTVRFQLGR